MESPSNHPELDPCRFAGLLGGFLTVIIGITGMLGWSAGIRALTSVHEGYIPIAYSTCIGFLVQGSVLVFHVHWPSLARRWPSLALVSATSIFGMVTFTGYLAGVDLNFEMLMARAGDLVARYPVNRMSPFTGLLFSLTGISLILLLRRGAGAMVSHLACGLSIPAAVAGLIVTISYIYGTPLLYGGKMIPLALSTGAGFTFLGFGLTAAAGPGTFILSPLSGGTIRAMLLRTFVPLGFVAVIVSDVLQLFVTRLNSALVSATSVVFLGIFIVILVVQASRRIGDIVERAEAERKRAEEALHRYALLAGHSRDIILFLRRGDGRILEANAAAVEAYGYSQEELLGLKIDDLRSPETRQTIQREIAEADERGILLETVHRRKDGGTFPVEVSSLGATIAGTRTLVSMIRDITERKKAEEVRNRLAAIVEGSEDAIISKTLTGEITSWNRGAEIVYGYSADEVIGKSVDFMIPPDRVGEIRDILKKISVGEHILHYETERYRKDGREISVSLSISPIMSGSGAVAGASSIARDITEKKAGEEEREELIKDLMEALAKVNTLKGLLPICSHCKKIRNDKGYWEQIESYIYQHSGTEFSHGICPDCLKIHYSEFLDHKENK